MTNQPAKPPRQKNREDRLEPSELERMTDLTRRIVNVPTKELAREQRKEKNERGH